MVWLDTKASSRASVDGAKSALPTFTQTGVSGEHLATPTRPAMSRAISVSAASRRLSMADVSADGARHLARTLEPVVGVVQMRDHAGQLFQQAGHLAGRYGGSVVRVKNCGVHD